MREILFRGKTKKGEWVEGFYYINRYRYAGGKDFIAEKPKITTGITEASGAYGERVEEIEYEIIPETVGQYTGLTDKNGKKIFEGDICQTKGFPLIDDKPFVVEWNDDECSFYWRDVVGTDEFNIGVSQNTTIIGNIHDNPELLKGENDMARYIVFECRKCGHNLYVENTEDAVKTIGKVSNSDCPHCGEEPEGNWVLVGLTNNSNYPEKGE